MSLFGDFDDDPFFGSQMRTMHQMNSMMNSMFPDPFGFMGGMGPPALGGPLMGAIAPSPRHDLMPFGFPNMNMSMGRLFPRFDHMGNNPNVHSFSSSSVMTMTNGPDGQPQVYQASSSTRTAPGGVKETKKTVCDSRSGTKKMAIGHHIGERAHILEREQNLRSGDREERQELINLDDDETEDFNREFEKKTRQALGAITYPSRHGTHRRHQDALPALPSRLAQAILCTYSVDMSTTWRCAHRRSRQLFSRQASCSASSQPVCTLAVLSIVLAYGP
uniref:(California timema) hypothetical protein n=2 Tax=Timema TaxID=61471 RepID=A0A7R9IYN9_TIMCA|nr:unnamed protein product [Timema californicum]